MKCLPEEFQQTINETFTASIDRIYAKEKIASLWEIPLNVGVDEKMNEIKKINKK